MKAKLTVEKVGLRQPKETVKNEKIEVNKENIENWFGVGSYSFVKKRLENKGFYGDAVGQGLRGYIEITEDQ